MGHNAAAEPWYFHSEPPTRQALTAWHAIERDGKLSIDPFAELAFHGLLDIPPPDRTKPGETLTVQTRLTTHDGLMLKVCSRSRSWDNQRQAEADVSLHSSAGDELHSAKVGFS